MSFGRYKVVRVLGRGAMGEVYEGIDPRLNRSVAIKVISTASRGDPELHANYSARFVQEARAVAQLNHPHIVTLYDFGEENGVAYMVMELVRGDELAAYFDMTQDFHLEFTLEDAVRMTCELLAALGYAHDNGVIHRDVKPANVMLTQDLRVKLTDFGVARLVHTIAALNATDGETEMVGTPSFMSPEQITGQAVGPQSDLFAVGIILYQFLTNERPFRGAGLFAVQQKILYEQPVPPTLLNPMLHPDYDRIVNRALAKQPQDRYPDARAFLRDLQRVMNGESVADATQPGGPREATLPPWMAAQSADPDATRVDRALDEDATVLHPQPRRAP